MKLTPRNVIGMLLVPIGLLVIGFSVQIVFPGLAGIIGVEPIAGHGKIGYRQNGSFYVTKPFPFIAWVLAVGIVGLIISASGVWLSGVRIKFPPRKIGGASN